MTKSKYIKNLISRTLITIILVLGSFIYMNSSDKNLLSYKKYVYTDSIKFNKINKYLKNIFGEKEILKNIAKDSTLPVFDEKLTYTNAEIYFDGASLEVSDKYLAPSLESGIVVFIGEKENYGNTIIVQGTNEVDYWYGNITNVNVKLYDYVEKGTLLGEVINEKLYLAFQKEGKFVSYEDYI